MRSFLLLAFLLLAACDTVGTVEHSTQYVVESYQVAGAPLQPVRLSRSAPVDAVFDFATLAVTGARVAVYLLDAAGEVAETYDYRPSGERGVYVPARLDEVRPLRRYRLEVTFPDSDDRITAETLVPGTFDALATNRDTVVYQGTEQFEITVTPSLYPGRQSFYIFSIEALEADFDHLTPFYRDIIDPDADDPDNLDDYVVNESPIVNEGNYETTPEGTLVIRVPWLAVVFFGDTRVTVNALDDNLYDFIRTQSVQQGGPTLAPGEIPNVLTHVDGGTGIFGSLARVSIPVFIAPPVAGPGATAAPDPGRGAL